MRRVVSIAALSSMIACAGTRLTVHIEPPKNASKAGFYTGLGALDDRCVPVSRKYVTDATGVADLQQEYCGMQQLVVAAPGYQTQRRPLDTCDTHYVQVDIEPAAPVTVPSDECATAALRALRIWLGRDAHALRDELVDPNDLPLYQREDQSEPWQMVLQPGRQSGAECSVAAQLYYDGGCETSMRVDLLRVGDVWRLRGLQDGE